MWRIFLNSSVNSCGPAWRAKANGRACGARAPASAEHVLQWSLRELRWDASPHQPRDLWPLATVECRCVWQQIFCYTFEQATTIRKTEAKRVISIDSNVSDQPRAHYVRDFARFFLEEKLCSIKVWSKWVLSKPSLLSFWHTVNFHWNFIYGFTKGFTKGFT